MVDRRDQRPSDEPLLIEERRQQDIWLLRVGDLGVLLIPAMWDDRGKLHFLSLAALSANEIGHLE